MATSVIAIALAAIIRAAAGNTANLAYLKEKTFAHWVAMNRMAELEVARQYPALGRKSGSEEMANREWYWSSEVKKTPDPDIRRVEVSVRLEEGSDAAVTAFVTGYFADNRPRVRTQ